MIWYARAEMRLVATSMALTALGALAAISWVGCTGLSGDCELNLTCPGASTTTTTTTTATTTTTTVPPKCDGFFGNAGCDACVQKSCCQELADCVDDYSCFYGCVYSTWPPYPECKKEPTATLINTFLTCVGTHCSPGCDPRDYCNPITNVPCPSDGTACDAAFPGIFNCLPPSGAVMELCDACDTFNGPWCNGGMRCHQASHTCARYCCTDADCGTGKCVFDQMMAFGAPLWLPEDQVGLCLDQAGTTAACDAPATSVSMGSCVGGYP